MTGAPAIPVHLVLGTLGSGKTTVIQRLLNSAPSDETWAVLVNEFGRVAIDSHLFENSPARPRKLIVKESRGGCLCCSSSIDLAPGLRELVDNYKPDRIFIEPTGLSDPESMRQQVLASETKSNVFLASTIAVVDIRLIGHKRFKEMPFLQSLLNTCDYVFGSKGDMADEATIELYGKRIKGFAIKYGAQVLTEHELEIAKLGPTEKGAPAPRVRNFSIAHLQDSDSVTIEQHEKWHARRILEQKSGYLLDGYIFDDGVSFDWEKLLNLMESILEEKGEILRLKGIFRTNLGYYSIQSVNSHPSVWQRIGESTDSRLEIIRKSNDSSLKPAIPPFDKAFSGKLKS